MNNDKKVKTVYVWFFIIRGFRRILNKGRCGGKKSYLLYFYSIRKYTSLLLWIISAYHFLLLLYHSFESNIQSSLQMQNTSSPKLDIIFTCRYFVHAQRNRMGFLYWNTFGRILFGKSIFLGMLFPFQKWNRRLVLPIIPFRAAGCIHIWVGNGDEDEK